MTKTVFITGASSGLGKATARFFAKQGWQVAATLRTPGKEHELGKLPNVRLFELDVTQVDQTRKAVAAAVDAFGKIDVVVNNAGGGSYGPLEFASEETIDWQFQLNVRGAINVTRAVLPHFRSAREEQLDDPQIIVGEIFALATGKSRKFRTLVGQAAQNLMALRGAVPIEEYLSTMAARFDELVAKS